MRKKNKGYSLTAKQRKNLRHSGNPAAAKPLSDEEKQQQQAEQNRKKDKQKRFMSIAAICIASALAVSAIFCGIILGVHSTIVDNTKTNPVAVIKLSNGKKIEVELFYDQLLTATDNGRATIANLIYLAENKFFDGTMFSNIAGGFLGFEGYTSPDTHRAKDSNFVAKLGGIDGRSNVSGTSDFKLGYRLTRKSIVAPNDHAGYMAMLTGSGAWGSSTSFILVSRSGAQLSANGEPLEKSYMSYFGKMTDASLTVAREIAAQQTVANENITGWKYAADYQAIMIESVRIDKLNSQLKKRILNEFEDFVLDKESTSDRAIKGGVELSTWRRVALGT